MSVERRIAPRRADVLRVLAEHRDELAALGITSLALFGSVARDDAGPNSDVDLLVELDPTLSVGLFKFFDVQAYLEEILGTPVDLIIRGDIKRQIRDRVLAEEIPALRAGPDGSLRPAAESYTGQTSRRAERGSAVAERNWTMSIEDMLRAIDEIAQFTDGMSFDTFTADRRTILAVSHSFAIIGEAERRVPPQIKARYPTVPWAKMRGMRNVLLHNYPDVNLTVLWETVRDDLPSLVPLLQAVIAQEDGP